MKPREMKLKSKINEHISESQNKSPSFLTDSQSRLLICSLAASVFLFFVEIHQSEKTNTDFLFCLLYLKPKFLLKMV